MFSHSCPFKASSRQSKAEIEADKKRLSQMCLAS
jgi:hypothetical protein